MNFFFFLLSIIIVLDLGSVHPKQSSDPAVRGGSRDSCVCRVQRGWCISYTISSLTGRFNDNHLQQSEIYSNCFVLYSSY